METFNRQNYTLITLNAHKYGGTNSGYTFGPALMPLTNTVVQSAMGNVCERHHLHFSALLPLLYTRLNSLMREWGVTRVLQVSGAAFDVNIDHRDDRLLNLELLRAGY